MTKKRFHLDRKNNELKERVKELEQENKRLKYDLEHKQEHINQLTRKPLLTDILPQAHDILRINNELEEENEQLKKENEKLHSKIFEMRTNEALERTEISKQSYDGYKTAKEFLKELEKW